MNTRADAKAKWILYKELELIPESYEEPRFKRINVWSWVKKAWTAIANAAIGNEDLRIWSVCDRTGTIVWYVHDPVTKHVSAFSSEAEVMAWIERRYYNHSSTL